MAKGSGKYDWSGVDDSRPCSSTNSQSDKYVPSSGDRGNDYKGLQDQRPSSSTTSQSVNVGNGKG